jgi:hypothetical protein
MQDYQLHIMQVLGPELLMIAVSNIEKRPEMDGDFPKSSEGSPLIQSSASKVHSIRVIAA